MLAVWDVDKLDDVTEQEGQDGAGMTVRGLALPQLLVGLLDSGRSHRDLRRQLMSNSLPSGSLSATA